MQAVEFKTIIQDGIIQLPDLDELTTGKEVQVIVMWKDTVQPQNMEDQLATDYEAQEPHILSFVAGSAQPDEKPSDFAGIWKNRKKWMLKNCDSEYGQEKIHI